VVTQLWQESGVPLAEIADHNLEMTVPRLVAGGDVHPVFDQWQTWEPSPERAAKVRKLLPIMPVPRRSDVVPAHQ
jgi:hypothetical protein